MSVDMFDSNAKYGDVGWHDGRWGAGPLDVKASVEANKEAASRELKHAFTPDKIKAAIDMIRNKAPHDDLTPVLGAFALPFAAVLDIVEAPILTLFAAKDAADVAAYGITEGFKKKK